MKVESDIKDINGAIVKDGDKVSFTYKGEPVEATVKYNNGVFGVNSPKNSPISCRLEKLKETAGDFEVIS